MKSDSNTAVDYFVTSFRQQLATCKETFLV